MRPEVKWPCLLLRKEPTGFGDVEGLHLGCSNWSFSDMAGPEGTDGSMLLVPGSLVSIHAVLSLPGFHFTPILSFVFLISYPISSTFPFYPSSHVIFSLLLRPLVGLTETGCDAAAGFHPSAGVARLVLCFNSQCIRRSLDMACAAQFLPRPFQQHPRNSPAWPRG